MTDTELYIETEDGKEYIGDVKNVEVETVMGQYGNRVLNREYNFNVGKLFEVD